MKFYSFTTLLDNDVALSEVQQISASRLLGNATGSTANVSQISLGAGLEFSGSTLRVSGGGDLLQTITMSANATYNKSDLTGNILFLSTDDITTRTFTVGTGFVANDKLTFIINWQNLGLIRLSIGGRNIWDIRGVILEYIFDGTYWRSTQNTTWVQDSGISGTTSLGEVLEVSGQSGVAIGRGKLRANDCIMIGASSGFDMSSNQSIGIGKGTAGNYSIGIGMNDLSIGNDAVGIGGDASSRGIGIGNNVSASVDGLCIGTSAENNGKQFAKSFGNYARGVHTGEIVFKIDNNANYSSIAKQSHLRIVNFGATTTNDTQTEIYLNDSTSADRLVIPAKSSYMIKGRMSAVQSDFSDVKHWEFNCSLLRDGSNNTTLQGTTNITILQESTGATTWDLILSADNTNESLKVEVVGEASQTIYWKGIFEIIDLMLP